MLMWLLVCLVIVFMCVGKNSILCQALIISHLYLNMKSVHLKKIHHDYCETEIKSNGIDMIKDFLAINFKIKDIKFSFHLFISGPVGVRNDVIPLQIFGKLYWYVLDILKINISFLVIKS